MMDDDELLGAWLDGEVDDPRLRERLEDPAFAARADRAAAALPALRGAHRAPVPDDLADRLLERLRRPEEAEGDPDAAAPVEPRPAAGARSARQRSTRPSVPPPPPRSGRARAPRSLRGLAGVAAALVLVVGGAAALVALVGGVGGDDSGGESAVMDTSAESEAAEAAATGVGIPILVDEGFALGADEATDEAGLDAGGEAAPEAESSERSLSAAGADPVTAQLRERLLQAPEAQELLGTSAPEADELAAATRARVERAPVFEGGASPAGCLSAITDGLDGPAVVARVEALQLDGEPALAYVLVLPGEDGTLQTAEAWVVDPDSCDTRRFVAS